MVRAGTKEGMPPGHRWQGLAKPRASVGTAGTLICEAREWLFEQDTMVPSEGCQ